MTWIGIKSTFLGFFYGITFGVVSYLSILGYFAHRDTQLTLTLDQQKNAAIWRAQDPLYTISIQNITSVIGSTPTITIEKQRSWPLMAACAAFGVFVGYATYRSHISRRKITPPPEIVPEPEPHPEIQP